MTRLSRLNFLAVFCVALLQSAAADAATARKGAQTNPEAAWQKYLNEETELAPRYRFPHAQCFRTAAISHSLPETLLLAVARGESDFDATARSRANAHGVMQILWPTTARHLGVHRLTDLYDPCTNIDAGARYLKELLAQFNGNLHLALAAYNYGPDRIAANPLDIPRGASWYSAYIFRHLNYVLGNRSRARPAADHLYSELGRTTLLSFGEPYRAAAFVERLEASAPALELDWFRKDTGVFSVVLLYEDREAFTSSARLLATAGFPLQ